MVSSIFFGLRMGQCVHSRGRIPLDLRISHGFYRVVAGIDEELNVALREA